MSLSQKVYHYDELWQEWQKKYAAAPPKVLTEDDWVDACAYFNKCSICGVGNIEEKLLVVPTYLGGKLYIYNVVPACEVCATRVRRSQRINPIKSFYSIAGADTKLVDELFRYLDMRMLNCALEKFNFEEDSLQITVVCTEDTSVLPFNGVHARRVFGMPKIEVLKYDTKYETARREETTGVTWRLVDEPDIE